MREGFGPIPIMSRTLTYSIYKASENIENGTHIHVFNLIACFIHTYRLKYGRKLQHIL